MANAGARSLLRWTRLTLLGLHLLRGGAIAAFLFPLQSPERRKREVERWSMRLLEILHVRLFLHGAPPAYVARPPLMLVANHVSWLDIFAINAVIPVRFVAKSEVRQWPYVGWLCARAGTLFIRRARRHDTARVNELVTKALLAGDVFAVFPEGTTTDGSTVLKFHSSLLEPAIAANAMIQPVAVRFERTDGTLCVEAAYDGDRTVWDTLIGITEHHSVLVHVCFLEPFYPGDSHRRDLARETHDVILRWLYPEAPRTRTEPADDLRVAAH